MKNKKFISFSKLLSRRILMVNVLTLTVLALLVITFITIGLKSMTNAYFISGLYGCHESIDKRLSKVDDDSLYNHIKRLDVGFNLFNPLYQDDINEKDNKRVWAYNVVIDSVGTYIYHPDRQRIGKRNFFDDIRQSGDALCKELVLGLNSNEMSHQRITIDGVSSYIFYCGVKVTPWRNAIIVPMDGLVIPVIITGLILLTIIFLGMLVAYRISRFTIHRATIPLRLLTKGADEVAQGNFQAPLPELKHNDEISQLRDSFANMQQSLTQYIELKTTTTQKAAMESELSIARDIQLSMVPTVFPQQDHIDIYASMTPAKAVGGDLYDFFVRDGQLFFCIGDVSGKGVPAALFMTETKSLFRAYSSNDGTPDSIVRHMNKDLSLDNKECMFVTFFVGILDLKSGVLRYCNAGHEAPIIIHKTAEPLSVNQILPIGLMEDTDYVTETVVIEPQTTILLFTDGLDEAMDADNLQFGEKRIFNELNDAIQSGDLSPKAVIERMTQAVHNYVGDTEQSDDLTMLCLRFK